MLEEARREALDRRTAIQVIRAHANAAAVATDARDNARADRVNADALKRFADFETRRSTLASPAGLTLREREVLVVRALGANNPEIAVALHLSERTVAHHVSAILGKLGVPTRTGAVEAARAIEVHDANSNAVRRHHERQPTSRYRRATRTTLERQPRRLGRASGAIRGAGIHRRVRRARSR